jgi:hypothetical protein
VRSGVEVLTAIGVLLGPRVGVTVGVGVALGVADGTGVIVGCAASVL